ncbi:MAG: helix-turn-helix transcriptional regulator [Alphaproteobacteria bacterium]|nr:helix-turn-helix transcriptional regulator [Alphaproteobacteria bacterium]
MQKKLPHPVDVHVGGRVRLRRALLKMSQERLASSLGLTFQQIQKYEKGSNRIGASRLWDISKTLNTPISYFYEGLAVSLERSKGLAEDEQHDYITEFYQSSDGLQLVRAFIGIKDPRIRRNIAQFVRSMAEAD